MTAPVKLCVGCDALRDQERVFCANCGEATDSYSYEPTEREAYAYENLSVMEKVRKFTPVVGFQREEGTGLIHVPGWEAA